MTKMKNITVSISETAYLRARVWTAEHGSSLSSVVAYLLETLPKIECAKKYYPARTQTPPAGSGKPLTTRGPQSSSPIVPSPLVPSPLVPSPLVPSPLAPSPLAPSPIVPSPLVPSPLVPSPLVPSPLVPTPSPLPSTPTPLPTAKVGCETVEIVSN